MYIRINNDSTSGHYAAVREERRFNQQTGVILRRTGGDTPGGGIHPNEDDKFIIGGLGEDGGHGQIEVFGYTRATKHSMYGESTRNTLLASADNYGSTRMSRAFGTYLPEDPVTSIFVVLNIGGGFRTGSIISLYGRGRS